METAQAPQEGAAALDGILQALKAAWQREPYPTLATRLGWLERLERLITTHADDLAQAVSLDFGHRSPVETELAEFFPSLQASRHARRHLARWMRPQRRGVSLWFQPARAEVRPQPVGVVGIIVPWNYPIFLALGPLVAALAAGNRVMIKMSEYTPHTGALLARLVVAHFGDDVIRVVNGDVTVAEAFSRLPFDHLLFTGSTAVGRHVMQAASANLTPVTLELGGKSPVIVTPGFDAGRAARRIVAGKMLNAGQTCVAPDYVLVHESDRTALMTALVEAARQYYPTLAENPDYSAIIHPRQYQRLQDWLEEARSGGATIVPVNPANEDLTPVRKLPLTLVWGAPAQCRLMREEIFGPLLPVVGYRDVDEALAYVAERPRPLALYLFDDDRRRVRQVLERTIAGGVTVNDTVLHVAQDDLPFGGVGPSGMGHYHAHEGFLTLSKLKPVFYQSRFNGMALTAPPYGRRIRWLLRWMLGRRP